MQVLALTEGPDHVCYRYRLQAFAAALAERGLHLSAVPLSDRTLLRTNQLREARRADIVVLQRKLLPWWQLRLLRRWAKVLVFDFDDALFCRDSYFAKPPTSLTRLAHFWSTIYSADLVLAGNPYLVERARALVEAHRVHQLPTCLDPRHYALAEHRATESACRLAWIGQRSTLACLDRARQQLAAVAAELPGLRLRVICNEFPSDLPLAVEPWRWSSASEGEALATADIGISWLPDDDWSRGKCGLKVLQYMAAGLPVVANPVGMNRQMVIPGETGYWAETPAQWAAAIRRLAQNADLRQRLGAQGRALVERRFSIDKWRTGLLDALTTACHMAADRRREYLPATEYAA